MKTLKCAKWLYIVCSLLLALEGAALIIWPEVSSNVICYCVGTLLLICGVAKLIGFFSHDPYTLAFQFDLALGVFMIAIAALLLFQPGRIISFLPLLIGLMVLVDGVFKLQTSLDARRFGLRAWWLIMLGGAVSALFALWLIADSRDGGTLLTVAIGISLVIDGVQNLFNALYTVRTLKAVRKNGYIEAEYEEKQ